MTTPQPGATAMMALADRLQRHGKELFDTAKAMGWQDDGESPLNFIARHEREQGRLYLAATPVGGQAATSFPVINGGHVSGDESGANASKGVTAGETAPLPQSGDVRERAIEECANIADKEANLLLLKAAEHRGLAPTADGIDLSYLHEQAGTAIQVVVEKIRALFLPAQKTDGGAYLDFSEPRWKQIEHRIKKLMTDLGTPDSTSLYLAMMQLIRDAEHIDASATPDTAPDGVRDWQPIETAPKDGARIDISFALQGGARTRSIDCVWDHGREQWRGGPPSQYEGGWVATHWMPRPTNPTRAISAGNQS